MSQIIFRECPLAPGHTQAEIDTKGCFHEQIHRGLCTVSHKLLVKEYSSFFQDAMT